MVGTVDGVKRMVKDPEKEDLVNAFYRYFRTHQSKMKTLKFIQKNYDPPFHTASSAICLRVISIMEHTGITLTTAPLI